MIMKTDMIIHFFQEKVKFAKKYRKDYKANKRHFREVEERILDIVQEALEIFEKRPRKKRVVIALIQNERSWWRELICIKIWRDGSVSITREFRLAKHLRVEVPSGYEVI